MPFILFAFILLYYSTFSTVYCGTIRTISASSFSSIIFSNDLTIGDGAGGNGFGLNLNSQNPTEIIPGRFRLSANPNDDFSLLVNQWDNFPEIPSAGRSVLVQIPFVVTRVSGQFRVSSTFNANSNVQQRQQFEFNSANSLYTERISSILARLTMGIFSNRNVQNAGSIFDFNSFSMQNGFRVDRQTNGNGFQLFAMPSNSNGQSPKDVPSRFRVSVDQNEQTMVRISQSNNNSISGPSKLNVPSGFRVVRTNSNRFMLRGPAPDEQQFDIPSSEFNVELAENGGNNVDITFNNGPSSTMTMMNNQRNIPNNAAPIRRDKIKSDGTTDCGPNIANLCNNPLYAQLIREQCPATCANFPNMAAAAQIQTIGRQPSMAANAPAIAIQQPSPPAIAPVPVAIQQPAAALLPIFPPIYPIIGRIGGANCGKKK